MSTGDQAAGHETFLREAIRLSRRAMERGDGPFGAVLVRGGRIVLARENTASTRADATRHAEMNLVVEAQESFGAEALGECTLYASTEPCAMCAGAIFWAGIRRVVSAIRARPAGTHVIVTGRDAPEAFVAAADLVTEMRLVKHPYREQGIGAQPGIEL